MKHLNTEPIVDSNRVEQVKSLLMDALDQEPSHRADFVRTKTTDSLIENEVLKLIDSHERAGEFLSNPSATVVNGDPSEHAETLGEVGSSVGRYTIHSLIGEGGFGQVYLAEQREPITRNVALKIIKLGMDTRQVIARFEAERQALAIMEHPSIAGVFDAGATETGRPYFVMELVRGVPITVYCADHQLSIEQRLNVFTQVCSAVQHAHTKGVIHRDLKPSNVLVTERDGLALPKVIDFGIAKATASALSADTVVTEFRQLIGTPQYMSPEQADINAADIDTRTDVYSLGILLYELLAGAPPFDGRRLRSSTFGEMQRIIREEEPLKPSTRLSATRSEPGSQARKTDVPASSESDLRNPITYSPSGLRGDLDWIILKAIEKDRERRYSSVGEFAEDIRRHLHNEPVMAGPAGLGYRLGKLFKRRRVESIAAIVILLTMIGGTIGTAVGMVQARRSAAEARTAATQATAVNDFMRHVLTSVEPDHKGADVKLAEVLDDATRTASQHFAGHPEQEAMVRLMLGDVYSRLSQLPQATAEFERAVRVLKSTAKPNDRRVFVAEVARARAMLNQGRVLDTDKSLQELLPRIRKALGPDDELVMEAEAKMATAYFRLNRRVEAETILRELHQRAVATPASPQMIVLTLNDLIFVLRGRFGIDHAENLRLAAEIESFAIEMVKQSTEVYGPDALTTFRARTAVADMMSRRGHFQGAIAESQAVLDTSEERLGMCHSQRISASEVLALAKHRLGRSQEAAEIHLNIIECSREHDNNTISLLSKIADALPFLDRGGRWIEGEALARELAAEMRNFGGGHGDMLIAAELQIARFVSLQGRFEEAELLFGPLLMRPQTDFNNVATFARLHMFFGSHLTHQGLHETAERHLQTAANALSNIQFGTTLANPDDLLLAFIDLYHESGQPEKAKEYQKLLNES
jgi:tetratricopeptide (TPR) repeat protein